MFIDKGTSHSFFIASGCFEVVCIMHLNSQQKKRSYAHYSDVDNLLDPSVKSDLACMKRFSSLYFVLLYVASYLVVFTKNASSANKFKLRLC